MNDDRRQGSRALRPSSHRDGDVGASRVRTIAESEGTVQRAPQRAVATRNTLRYPPDQDRGREGEGGLPCFREKTTSCSVALGPARRWVPCCASTGFPR